MPYRQTAAVMVMLGAIWATSCSRAEGHAAAAPSPAKLYALTTTAPPVKAGEHGALVVTVTPQPPFKWNDEYPARFQVVPPANAAVTFAETAVRKGSAALAVQPGSVSVTFPFTATTIGRVPVVVQLNFSVCTDTVCHRLPQETTTVELVVE